VAPSFTLRLLYRLFFKLKSLYIPSETRMGVDVNSRSSKNKPRSNENKSCTRVDESWLDITARVAKSLINSHQNLIEPTQTWWESIIVGAQTRARVETLIISNLRLTARGLKCRWWVTSYIGGLQSMPSWLTFKTHMNYSLFLVLSQIMKNYPQNRKLSLKQTRK
jgi:hypothetical protein